MQKTLIQLILWLLLGALMALASACNLTTIPAAPDYNATSTALSSSLNTKVAELALATPTEEPTATPSPTLEPAFLTATLRATFAVVTPPSRPAVYTLKQGEFPYCIARRFNVDPKELLTLNSLSSGLIYSPGLTLTLPQTGKPFPAQRWLHAHPADYTVPSSMTVQKLACYFGDVDPDLIKQANGLTSDALSAGQTLFIP